MNIYVGNLSYDSTDADIREAFEKHGQVEDVRIIKDRETGRSKGFAFVEMSDDSQAQKAIAELDGADFLGRRLKVNEARPREERRPRGGGDFGRY